jgi:hypothetical protein
LYVSSSTMYVGSISISLADRFIFNRVMQFVWLSATSFSAAIKQIEHYRKV